MDIKDIANILDNVLSSADLSGVTADGAGFTELPDGYYLTEVVNADLTTSKSSGNPMVKMQLKVLNDGYKLIQDENDEPRLVPAKGTKGRMIFKNYVLTDEQSVKRFVSDMLKFENPDEPGESILSAEYFLKTELLLDALEIIKEGSLRIYVNLSTYTKSNGEKGNNTNLVKWSAIEQIAEDYNITL